MNAPVSAFDRRPLNRDRLIAELLLRAHAFRNMEAEWTTRRDMVEAGLCRARAEVYEQFARDLEDHTLSLGEGVRP